MKENNVNSKEKFYEFNSFLNKVIIFSGKEFYRKELKNRKRELELLDNDSFENIFIDTYIYEEKFFENQTSKDVLDFINFCENLNLHCALKSLSAIEQEVIFLLYSKELSQEEAAKILNVCSKSVSRIKVRAFDKLRKFLKGDK